MQAILLNHQFENSFESLMDTVLAQQDQYKCGICSCFFASYANLRQHTLTNHKGRKICSRCPYTGGSPYNVRMHEQSHFRNDAKFKNKAEGRECKLCHVWFGTNGHLILHLRQFHLPDSQQILLNRLSVIESVPAKDFAVCYCIYRNKIVKRKQKI